MAEYRFFGIKLNTDKDADLISYLESKKNKQYIIKKALYITMLNEIGDVSIIVKSNNTSLKERGE